MLVFDAPLLRSTLRSELRAAWQRIHTGHVQEGLYGFGVYTTMSADYLTVTAFSEAGLAKAAANHPRQADNDAAARCLRWSPCDSPLHLVGEPLLPKSDQLVQALDLLLREDDSALEAAAGEVFRIAVQVLQEMDREGIFGTGAERERLVLCIWQGDQSNIERYEFAKALNPPAVAKRFGEELNDGVRAFFQLAHPDWPAPKDDVFD